MKNESKYTPGPWIVGARGEILGPHSGCSRPIIANMPVWWFEHRGTDHASQQLQESNAALIAEAGTVAHETGLTPRQLAEQRAELLAACKDLLAHLDAHSRELVILKRSNACKRACESAPEFGATERLIPARKAARAAIAKAEGK